MKAEYIDHLGTDLTVVNAARVSFDKESDIFTYRDETVEGSDEGLVTYLAKHNHWTPFSHPQITMRETVPIFVARQRFKHMVGFTYNEVSRRYVDDTPEFFTPDVWRGRPKRSMKQGSGDTNVSSIKSMTGRESFIREEYETFLRISENLYSRMLKGGVAPEQARMVLPQSMYTSYYVTGSLAAWARAYKQRIDAHSQVEIQMLAKQWGNILEPLFPECWKVLT